MEIWAKNYDLWNSNVNLSDNSTVTIGTVFKFLAPHPVEISMAGYITPLVSKFKAVTLKSPYNYSPVSIENNTQGKTEF